MKRTCKSIARNNTPPGQTFVTQQTKHNFFASPSDATCICICVVNIREILGPMVYVAFHCGPNFFLKRNDSDRRHVTRVISRSLQGFSKMTLFLRQEFVDGQHISFFPPWYMGLQQVDRVDLEEPMCKELSSIVGNLTTFEFDGPPTYIPSVSWNMLLFSLPKYLPFSTKVVVNKWDYDLGPQKTCKYCFHNQCKWTVQVVTNDGQY